jgi:hypothetical protein
VSGGTGASGPSPVTAGVDPVGIRLTSRSLCDENVPWLQAEQGQGERKDDERIAPGSQENPPLAVVGHPAHATGAIYPTHKFRLWTDPTDCTVITCRIGEKSLTLAPIFGIVNRKVI